MTTENIQIQQDRHPCEIAVTTYPLAQPTFPLCTATALTEIGSLFWSLNEQTRDRDPLARVRYEPLGNGAIVVKRSCAYENVSKYYYDLIGRFHTTKHRWHSIPDYFLKPDDQFNFVPADFIASVNVRFTDCFVRPDDWVHYPRPERKTSWGYDIAYRGFEREHRLHTSLRVHPVLAQLVIKDKKKYERAVKVFGRTLKQFATVAPFAALAAEANEFRHNPNQVALLADRMQEYASRLAFNY
jgi:hypothetical protein